MERLNKNKYGQFDDERATEIGEDFEKAVLPFIEKWNNIDGHDIEIIVWHLFTWLMCKSMLRNTSRIDKNEGEDGKNGVNQSK